MEEHSSDTTYSSHYREHYRPLLMCSLLRIGTDVIRSHRRRDLSPESRERSDCGCLGGSDGDGACRVAGDVAGDEGHGHTDEEDGGGTLRAVAEAEETEAEGDSEGGWKIYDFDLLDQEDHLLLFNFIIDNFFLALLDL